jgi:hypothetical protein
MLFDVLKQQSDFCQFFASRTPVCCGAQSQTQAGLNTYNPLSFFERFR